jgi:hypothetical protein
MSITAATAVAARLGQNLIWKMPANRTVAEPPSTAGTVR